MEQCEMMCTETSNIFEYREPRLELKKISLSDKKLFKNVEYIGSDYMFSTLYMYSSLFGLKIYHDEKVIIIYEKTTESFYLPIGNIEYGIKLVLEYCKNSNIIPNFTKIPENYIQISENMNFFIEEDRNSFDYIYSNQELSNFEGGSFRKQRNNLSNYLKSESPVYIENIGDKIEQCIEFTKKHYEGSDILNSTLKILESFKEFDLEGGIVWNNNDIQAFCIYEKVTEDSVISHVELNDNSHRGLHTYMINEMSKRIGTEFINKEDDMGLPGLRRFKETYNPVKMIKKYRAY